MQQNTLVLAEARDGRWRNVTFEIMSAASTIIQSEKTTVVVFGTHVNDNLDVLSHHGADKIIHVDQEEMNTYHTESYADVLTGIIQEEQPDVVLLGHTAIGKDLAPRVAHKLDWGLISDCIDLEVTDNNVLFTRPIYAGKAFQQVKPIDRPIFATIRPNNIPVNKADFQRSSEKVVLHPKLGDIRTIVKKVIRNTSREQVDLNEAKVIVAGGRGVKSKEGFAPLYELAEILGAAVGASRGACDAGYCDYGMQIGQTGKVVTPNLYIACGISGAIQHLAGMSNSKVIVAINKDPEAPIFQVADYGIVGDLFEVVPMLTAKLKQMLD